VVDVKVILLSGEVACSSRGPINT